MFPCLQVARLEFCKLQVRGNDHVVEAILGCENLRVAEIGGGVAIIITFQHPHVVLRPCFEVWRGSSHHSLNIGTVGIMTCIIDVIETILLIIDGTTRTQCGILLRGRSSCWQNLAQRNIVGAILGGYAPDGVIVVGIVHFILLQVEYLELSSLLVIERHGVATTSDSRIVISLEALFV